MRHKQTRVFLAMAWHELGHLEGIYRYACEKNWILSQWYVGHSVELPPLQPHGIISQLSKALPDLTKMVTKIRVPVVELGSAIPDMRVPRVIPDEPQEAEVAAAHLLERGFRRCVMVWHSAPASLRQAFTNAVRASGGEATIIDTDDPDMQCAVKSKHPFFEFIHDPSSVLRQRWARRFFAAFEKPVGVYVQSLAWANDIIEACRDARILVPEQVAVMAKVDMPLQGVSLPVPLTVLAANYEEQGYQAAKLLDRIMGGERIPSPTIVKVPPTPLVQRSSTLCHATENLHVARAVAFIMRNLHNPDLCAKQVTRAAKASRCTFYTAFCRQFGMPVAHYIEHLRIKEASRLLAETDAAPGAIADRCGFGELRRLRNALIRTKGMTPLAYRKKHRATLKKGSGFRVQGSGCKAYASLPR